jgi:hypothetical protein
LRKTHTFAVEIAFLYQYSLVSGDGVIGIIFSACRMVRAVNKR